MTHNTILLGAVVILLLCIAVPEALQIKKYGLADKTISHYLRGPLGYVTDIGFLLFGLAMAYVGWTLGPTVTGWSAGVLGAAMIAVMLTARIGDLVFENFDQANRAHVAVTVVALIAAAALIVAASRDPAMWALGAAYPIAVALGFTFKLPIAVTEKLGVMMIALWLVAYALGVPV